ASLTATMASGTYYLVVHSSGGYGNLGRYALHGSVAGATSAPNSQPPPATTQNQPAGRTSPATATSHIVDDGAAAFMSLGGWTTLTGIGDASDIRWSAAGSGAVSTWT